MLSNPCWPARPPRPLSLRRARNVTRQGMSLAGWARSVRELFVGDRPRSMTLVGDRAYVEFRGVARDDLARFSEQLSERSRGHENITGVHVNGLMRRVAFQFSGTIIP